MKTLEYPEIINVTKEELVEFQLRYILKGVAETTPTDEKILSHVYFYKDKAIDTIHERRILTSRKSIENYISKYRKLGVIVGKGKNTRLNPSITLVEEDMSYVIKFKLKDKDKDNVEMDNK